MKRGIKEMNIILASGSPRRKELLAQAGFDFEVEVSNADENVAEESPTEMVEELAARKAEAVVNLHNKKEDNCHVIGADTFVVLDGKILGKPSDEADARAMLASLSGRTHQVYTGVALFSVKEGIIEKKTTFHECTDVTMVSMTEKEIADYVHGKTRIFLRMRPGQLFVRSFKFKFKKFGFFNFKICAAFFG